MTNQELIEKDFQLASLRLLMDNNAMLRTILINQATIFEKLGIGDFETNMKDFEKHFTNSHEHIINEIKSDIPNYQFVPREMP